MMFRLIYRLKKNHGAVLFTVIAIMALLVAMSTAAYYTARGSYNTVVSSYSYSQLYLSAISAADMVSDAIIYSEIPGTTGHNNFAPVQNAVNSHLNPVDNHDGTFSVPTDTIYLKSSNITADFNASTQPSAIINALRSANPIEPGVLDGLTIKISVLDVGSPENINSTTVSSGPPDKIENQTFTQKVKYAIETTAYYGDDMITVQDVIVNDKAGTRTVKTPVKSVPGSSTTFPPLNPNASTGQGKLDADGKSTPTGRGVLVSVKRLDGNMTFHNDITYIGSAASNNVGNKIDGSLVSHGSMYFSKCSVNVSGSDNHWYIGGDFVTTNDQTGTIKLNDNNLYIGGDMILGTQQTVQAKEIFVNGDLYVLKQSTIDTTKLHVTGNIYFTEMDSNGNLRTEALNKSLDPVSGANDNINSRLSGNFELELGGKVVAEGKVPQRETQYDSNRKPTGVKITNANNSIQPGQQVKIGNKYSNIQDGSSAASIPDASVFDNTTQLTDGYTVLERDDTQDKYIPVHKDGSLLNAIADNTNQQVGKDADGNITMNKGDQITYPNYTANESAYKNELVLDFGNMKAITETKPDETLKTIGFYQEIPIVDKATGATIATATIKMRGSGDTDTDNQGNAQDVTINIPYVEDGFILKYANTNFMGNGEVSGNATIKYNIISNPDEVVDDLLPAKSQVKTDSGSGTGKTMPIVLAGNMSDGNFSWKGDGYNNNGSGAYVAVSDDMKVSFEMGNLDTDDNEYKPYDNKKDNENKIKIPTYHLGQKTAVGSESLINMMKNENTFMVSKDEGNGSLKIGNAALTTIPDNNIMIVSNSSGTAFQADYQNTIVGGYLYAPSGQLAATNDTNGAVINIGSVVISDYAANHVDYHVVLPKPSDMDAFIGPLSGGGGGVGGGGIVDDPSRPVTTTYGAYTFGDWTVVGSNYVG